MDVELPAVYGYGPVLAKAVADGKVPESLLDESVRRVLRDKFALGLFDDPYVREDPVEIRAVASEGDELSRRLAAESVTLLKNERDLLPLSRDIAKVAVIGPHADGVEVGFPAYTYPAALKLLHDRATGGESLDGGGRRRRRCAARGDGRDGGRDARRCSTSTWRTTSSPRTRRCRSPRRSAGSCRTPRSPPSPAPGWCRPSRRTSPPQSPRPGRPTWSSSTSAAARRGPDERTEGEGTDTANIDLPAQQVELINAVTAVGKPTVAVVAMGRPQGLAAVIDQLPAVLTAYFGGPHQGAALADALFGVTNPGGKLPFTLPRHVGQVPIHHGQKTGSGYRRTDADIHKGYLDMPSTPLFAFGHGLSYTTFEYGPLELESDTVDVSGELAAVPHRHQHR